jgi:L-threonylcarbamoyladenylate synthase
MSRTEPSGGDIQTAARILKAGGLVAFPTETVYGLGADAFNPAALSRVFAVKKRPRFDPLIVHIPDRDGLEAVADIHALPPESRGLLDALAARFWPGPLTLILPKKPEVPDLATSGLPTVAVRVPKHRIAQTLIRLSTGAVAAPSANPFGYLSPTTAGHVREQLGGQVDAILDGGPAEVGLESTVLDITRGAPRILRPGGTAQESIERVLGRRVESISGPGELPCSPGQLKSHYAPRVPLILQDSGEICALAEEPSAGYLFFTPDSRSRWVHGAGLDAPRIQTLTETGDLIQGASRLFRVLHELDKLPLSVIHAERVPDQGLGKAINDRLSRAAAG